MVTFFTHLMPPAHIMLKMISVVLKGKDGQENFNQKNDL
jgi:hypothetical protein